MKVLRYLTVSKRITRKWTNTTKEAYGDNEYTDKGLRAEKLILEYLESTYHDVIWYENDKEKQIAGIDFEFKKNTWANYYSVDVKANLKNGFIFVYPDEISRKKNHRMMHVDMDEGVVVEYDRASMIDFINRISPEYKIDKNGKKYVSFNVSRDNLGNNIEYFRRFKLKNFTPPKKDLSNVLDKYEPIDL